MITSNEAYPAGGSGRAYPIEYIISRVQRNLTAILGGIAAVLMALLALQPAWPATFNDPRTGSLLLKDDQGAPVAEAVRLGIDVNLTVSGPTVRARVTQVFRNPTAGWVEAVYVYPLPDGGAVDTLKMVVGERIILGDIKERAQATSGPNRTASARR